MKFYLNNVILTLVIILFFISCKKDNPTTPGTGSPSTEEPFVCEEFDWTLPPMTPLDYIKDSKQYRYGVYNPTNQNEIIYFYSDYDNFIHQLIKYNILTKQKQVLLDNVFLQEPPSWSASGWISFGSGEIYIIKDDGTGLSLFASGGINNNSRWTPDGEFLIWDHTGTSNPTTSLLKKGISQQVPDTIINPSGGGLDISVNNTLIASSQFSFYYLNADFSQTYSYTDFTMLPQQIMGLSKGLTWNNDGSKFYVSKFYGASGGDQIGLFEVNFPSGTYTKLMDFCDNRRYSTLSCSPDGKYLIAQRIDCYQQLDSEGQWNGNIVENSSIVRIYLPTMTEMKLNL